MVGEVIIEIQGTLARETLSFWSPFADKVEVSSWFWSGMNTNAISFCSFRGVSLLWKIEYVLRQCSHLLFLAGYPWVVGRRGVDQEKECQCPQESTNAWEVTGLVTSSILFCWLFTIKDQFKNVFFFANTQSRFVSVYLRA